MPANVTLRDFGGSDADGQNKYMMNLYLRERGDAKIKSNADLIANSNFHNDPKWPDRLKSRENVEKVTEIQHGRNACCAASRYSRRSCNAWREQKLDALVYPTSNLPPTKLGAPQGPPINGRNGGGVWSFLGAQGFPVITVPAGFTTEVYDLIRDPTAPANACVCWTNAAEVAVAVGRSRATIALDSSGRSLRNCRSAWTSSVVRSMSR